MSYEIDLKKMSIAMNKAEEDYFTARPQIDCNDRRKVFESGFKLAWNARQLEIDRLRDWGARVAGVTQKQPDSFSCSGLIDWLAGYPTKPGDTEEETTMRELNEHKINPSNDTLTITVLDEPGHGGANHAYVIEGGEAVPTHLRFQNGPINADGNGVNGITHEALLAVLCDRLRGFQAGPYACKANACALTHLEEAQHWLQQRTIERMRRGVEGTHTI